MNSVFAVLCSCYFYCVIGSTVPESTTVLVDTEPKFLQDGLITDHHLNKTFLKLAPEFIINTSDNINKTKTSLESSNHKINESELYEDGQTVKENNERAFILINQKFKSLWLDGKRPIVPKTKFKSVEQFTQFDKLLGSSIGLQSVKGSNRPSYAHKSNNGISNAYSYKSKTAYFSPVKAVPARIPKEKEYIEHPKKPLIWTFSTQNRPGNVETNSHKAFTEFFRSQHDDLPKEQYYNDDEDSIEPKIAIQNQHHTHTKCNHRDPNALLFERFPITYYDKSNVNDFEDDKLDHYIRNTLKHDKFENEINNNMYNCYNESCKKIVNEYNQKTFNGIRQGYLCVCDYINTGDRTGRVNERPLKEDVSTEIGDLEAVIKETESLNKLSEEKTDAFE